jgi:hypothetical protein
VHTYTPGYQSGKCKLYVPETSCSSTNTSSDMNDMYSTDVQCTMYLYECHDTHDDYLICAHIYSRISNW